MLFRKSIRRDSALKDENESKARYTWAAAFRALLLFVLVIGLGTLRPPLVAEGAKRDCGPVEWVPPNPPTTISNCTAYDDLLPHFGPCPQGGPGSSEASGGEGAGSGGAVVGPGLFVQVATGNVWTEVPVVEVAADGKALDFRLRYDSRFAGGDGVDDWHFRALVRRTVLGPGWTHSYNAFAFKGDSWEYAELMVIDRQGRRASYAPLSEGVGSAKNPGVFSWITEPEEGTYRVHHRDGGYEEYVLIDDVTPQYMEGIEAGFTDDGTYDEETGEWYRLMRIVDRRGRETGLTYDHQTTGLLTGIQGPYGRTIELAYKSGTELLEEIHHPDDEVTTLSYDEYDRLVGIQDPEQNSRTYEYVHPWQYHRIKSETLGNGIKYSIEGTCVSGMSLYDTDAGGSNQDMFVDIWVTGDTWIDRANYDTYSAQARIDGGLVDVRAGDSDLSWTYAVDTFGRITSVTPPADPDDPTARTVVNTYDLDTNGFSAGTHTLAGAGTGWLRSRQVGEFSPTYYAYEAASGKIASIVDPEGNLTEYEYTDSNGLVLVTRKIEPDGDAWSYDYDWDTGDLLSESLTTNGGSAASRTIIYTHTYYSGGPPGRLAKRTRTGIYGNTTTWNFSSNGTIDSVVVDEGGLDVTTLYTHDVMGRVLTRTQVRDEGPDVEAAYSYDAAGRLTRTVVNSNGLALETVYELDGEGYVTAATDPLGMVTQYEYDRRNRLTKQTVDSNGLALTTQYEYDLANNLTKITDPELNEINIAYYKFDLARVITDAEGYDSKLKWDALGNLARMERERMPGSDEFYVTSFAYDGLSRLTRVTQDPDGLDLETAYTYDAGGGGCGGCGTPGTELVSEITDPAGKHTFFQYDELDRLAKNIRKVGDTGSEPDEDDVVTTLEYDETNDLVDILNPENELVRYTLDDAGRLAVRAVDPAGANLTTTYSYDGNGPARTVTPPNGNSVTRTYDAAGRLTESSDLTDGRYVSYTYNAVGNVLTVVDGEDNLTSNGYDRVGRLVSVKDPNGETETYTYDNNGNLTRMTDCEGRQTKYEHDDLGRIVRATEDESDGGLKRVTDYTYDGLDNILTLTAYTGTNGTGTVQTTTYEFDSAGRLVKVVYPDNDAGSNGIARFSYNPAGTIHTRTDQKGVVTTYTYDDLHRLTNRAYDDGGVTPADTFEYDKAGRLTRAVNATADVNFVYDDVGRLTDADQEVIVFEGSYATDLQYEVDPQAHTQTRRLTYPGASADVVETYDGRGRLDSIVYGAHELVGSSSYDDADRLTAHTLGNGISSSYTYDPNGWVQQIEYVKDTLTLEHIGYGYDKVGNVTYRQVATPGREHLSEIYQYDTLHRLTRYDRGVLNAEKTAVTEAAPRPFAQTRQWSNLDLLGNWLATDTTIGGEDPVTDTRTANAANEYLSQQIGQAQQIDLVSDDNGNLTTNGSHIYVYDGENRLIKVQNASDDSHIQWYWYDALGRRVAMWYNTMVVGDDLLAYVYADGAACLAEYYTGSTQNTLNRQYIHGPNFPDPLVMVDLTDKGDVAAGTEEYLYYLKDLLGSVTALANSNGTVVERYVYDPYGKTTVQSVAFYHDADFDGDVDETDQAHILSCMMSRDPLCVFVHDRDGDNWVTALDLGASLPCWTTNGVVPGGAGCARASSSYFDPDSDGDVDLYDFSGFQECMGSGDEPCLFLYDVDEDDEVDLDDFIEFQETLNDSTPPTKHTVPTGQSRYGNPFMWTGQRYDAPVGLYHFFARSYSPTLGRFLQRDPLGYVDGASLYEYVGTYPTSAIDPWGEGILFPGPSYGGRKIELHPNVQYTPEALEIFKEQQRRCQEFLDRLEKSRRIVREILRGLVDAATAVIPGVSDVRDAVEVKVGRDVITGETLSPVDRGITVVAAVVPIIPAKAARVAKKAVAEKAGKVWDWVTGRAKKPKKGAKRGPKTNPNAPHNKTIRDQGDLIEQEGGTVIAGGGREKERLIPTPGGKKSGRRPDIFYRDKDGTVRGRNVGKTKADGTPVTREADALDDLNQQGGLPTDFVPYD